MNENISVLMKSRATDGKVGFAEPPEDMAGLIKWLQDMKEEEKRLRSIEMQFKSTGSKELLQEFMPPDDKFDRCHVIDDIPRPYALWYPEGDGWSEADKQQHHDDVKRMFPNTKLHLVTCTDGVQCYAYSGTDTRTMSSAVELLEKERTVQKAIDEGSGKLNELVSTRKIIEGNRTETVKQMNLLKGHTRPQSISK